MRKQNKKYFDLKHFATNKNINKNDFILFHDIQHENDQSINRKLKYKWRKLFRVKKIIQNKEIYFLQKFNEIDLIEIFVENKIKKFHQKQSLKISSFAFSNSIINDHEFIDENDVMKKIFNFQFLIFEKIIVCDNHFLNDESILKTMLRVFEKRITRISRFELISCVISSLSFRRKTRNVCVYEFLCLCAWKKKNTNEKRRFRRKVFFLLSLEFLSFEIDSWINHSFVREHKKEKREIYFVDTNLNIFLLNFILISIIILFIFWKTLKFTFFVSSFCFVKNDRF
jgi:hypothetical protein